MSSLENESDVDCSEPEDYDGNKLLHWPNHHHLKLLYFTDYYNPCDDTRDDESANQKKRDPEYFEFECLTVDQVIYFYSQILMK